ncbi:binding partner of ACD11 1-like [Abrus precatorius]|uniref:Binding partner of ACD11 1-like n=1 Tax=Abrus precatorius TaxID=3816 RepID=A0A8B8KJ03_ABRPR|nr:binding partner of ACD11 1-like [Abrus precatorius]
MQAPLNDTDQVVEAIPRSTATPIWTNNVSDIKTVKVSNISMSANEKDIEGFFSFSGDIQNIEMLRETESTQVAYVTFRDSQGADTAVLLTGSNIVNIPVTITPVENYQLPPVALPSTPEKKQTPAGVKKAEDAVSTMLAKGFILGKDALNKAKSFDERHHLTSNASATVASIDRKMGISDKLSIGTTIVNEKVREMDEKYQVFEKTKCAIAVAEQKASIAGSAIMSNPYVLTGAMWVSNAITAVAKAAEDVTTMTKKKLELAEVEKKDFIYSERKSTLDELEKHQNQKLHNEDSPAAPLKVPVNSGHDDKKLETS